MAKKELIANENIPDIAVGLGASFPFMLNSVAFKGFDSAFEVLKKFSEDLENAPVGISELILVLENRWQLYFRFEPSILKCILLSPIFAVLDKEYLEIGVKLQGAANHIELGEPTGIIVDNYIEGLSNFDCRVLTFGKLLCLN